MDVNDLKPIIITQEQIRESYEQGVETIEELVFSLLATTNQLIGITQEQNLKIETLEKRNKNFENLVSQNSRNSHKPPSTDSPFQNKSKSRRSTKKTENKRKGITARLAPNPDEKICHTVSQCSYCHTDLSNIPVNKIERRQIVDIPPVLPKITEHDVETKVCPGCGRTNKGEFPLAIRSRFQYSTRIQAMAVYLKDYQLVPVKRVKELFHDLFSLNLSEGTLINMATRCSSSLETFVDQLKNKLPEESILHCDETGINIAGKLNWIHTVGNDQYTFLHPHSKRGTDAINQMAVLTKFEGVCVHDFWKPYEKILCKHSYCNAHILRELIAAADQWHQHWAKDMIRLLLRIKKDVDDSPGNFLNSYETVAFRKEYKDILCKGYVLNPQPENIQERAKPKKGKILCLIERMDKYDNDILRFMTESEVPFDNNLAERDLRMLKVRQKISGTFRNMDRAEDFCRIRSYISTLKKQEKDIFKQLCAVVDPENQLKGDSS